jgi:flavin-binding protein dodecin
MSVVKVIEVIGLSEKSWDDAIEKALERTANTVENIVGIDVVGMKGTVKNNKIVEYKAHVKIAFIVGK